MVAGAIFLNLGTRAIYKYGASDLRYQALRGNNLVIWEAIKFFGEHGYRTLDFGRTDLPAEGLRRFKCGWGATERSIEYVSVTILRRTLFWGKARISIKRCGQTGCFRSCRLE